MSLRILTLLSMCFVSLSASAISSTEIALDSLRDLQRGVRNGHLEEMSPERQKKFLQLLSEASKTLYDDSSEEITYTCASQGNGWYAIVNADTAEKLGQSVSFSDCTKSLPAPGAKHSCVPEGNGWYALYDLIRVEKMGQSISFSDCSKTIPKRDAKFACVAQGNGWFAVYNLKTGQKLGQSTSFSDCERSLPGGNN